MSFVPEIRGNTLVLPVVKGGQKTEEHCVEFKDSPPQGRYRPFRTPPKPVAVQFKTGEGSLSKTFYLNQVQLEKWVSAVGQPIGNITGAESLVLRGHVISTYAGLQTVGPATPVKQPAKNPPITPGTFDDLFDDEVSTAAQADDTDTVDTAEAPSSRSTTPSGENVGDAPEEETVDETRARAGNSPIEDLDGSAEATTTPAPVDSTPAAASVAKQEVKPRFKSPKGAGAPPKVEQPLSSATRAKIAAAVLVTSVALGALAYLNPFAQEAVRTVDSFWDIGSLDDVWLYLGY